MLQGLCKTCQKIFRIRVPAMLKSGRGKYCSKECYYKSIIGTKRPMADCIKISKATKGKNNPFYGKKHTRESLKKMILAKTGQKYPRRCTKFSKKCIICTKQFETVPSSPKKYCSIKCYGDSCSKRIVGAGGYILIYKKDHPAANRNYVAEHRLVVEAVIKRYLMPNETIHHIDLNRKNNNFDNLYIFNSKSEHTIFHNLLRKNPNLTLKSNLFYAPTLIPFFLNFPI